jgi:hypothetical protein
MQIDINDIVKKIDIKNLIEDYISSEISDYIDIEEMVNEALEEDETLKDFVNKRVVDIIDLYLSSDEGKACIIEKFKDTISDPDIILDIILEDRMTNIILEFLKRRLNPEED